MKKITGILMACILVLGLSACKAELTEDAGACTIEQNGVNIRMSFDAEGDKIVKIKQESVLSLEGYSEEDKAMIQVSIDQAAAEYKDIEGVTYTTEENGDEIVEKIEMNVGDKETLQAVVSAGLLPVDDEDVTELSLEKTLEGLGSSGWTVEE